MKASRSLSYQLLLRNVKLNLDSSTNRALDSVFSEMVYKYIWTKLIMCDNVPQLSTRVHQSIPVSKVGFHLDIIPIIFDISAR